MASRVEEADSHGQSSLASYPQVEVVVLSPRDGWGRAGELPVNLTEHVSECKAFISHRRSATTLP